ncbi:MAG: hypothetical protein ACI8ZM_000567 [Crocinitomix sp.]|jgi:hypothetical protein
MKLEKLGYTPKWIKFKFLNEAIFNEQIEELEKGESENIEHFRYYTFIHWLESKKTISNKEIENYLLLAHEDEDQLMAGSAVRSLFQSPILTDEQYKDLKEQLAEFGDWTKKLIVREDLTKRMAKEELTFEFYQECLAYKNKFDDSRLLVAVIAQTTDEKILLDFETNECGKRIRTLASKRLNKLKREA